MCQGPLPAPAHRLLSPASTCPLGKGWGHLGKYLPKPWAIGSAPQPVIDPHNCSNRVPGFGRLTEYTVTLPAPPKSATSTNILPQPCPCPGPTKVGEKPQKQEEEAGKNPKGLPQSQVSIVCRMLHGVTEFPLQTIYA